MSLPARSISRNAEPRRSGGASTCTSTRERPSSPRFQRIAWSSKLSPVLLLRASAICWRAEVLGSLRSTHFCTSSTPGPSSLVPTPSGARQHEGQKCHGPRDYRSPSSMSPRSYEAGATISVPEPCGAAPSSSAVNWACGASSRVGAGSSIHDTMDRPAPPGNGLPLERHSRSEGRTDGRLRDRCDGLSGPVPRRKPAGAGRGRGPAGPGSGSGRTPSSAPGSPWRSRLGLRRARRGAGPGLRRGARPAGPRALGGGPRARARALRTLSSTAAPRCASTCRSSAPAP